MRETNPTLSFGNGDYIIGQAANSSVSIPESPADGELNVSVKDKTPDSAIVVVDVPNNGNGTVTVTVGGKEFTAKATNGKAEIPISDLSSGKQPLEIQFVGDDGSTYLANSTIDLPIKTPITVEASYDKGNVTFDVTLPNDIDGEVTLDVNGISYQVPIVNGKGQLKVSNLTPNDYEICVSYAGDNKYANASNSTNLKVPPIATRIIVDSAFTRVATDYYAGERGGNFSGYLEDIYGNRLANKLVRIALNGPVYEVFTDDNGLISLQINLMNENVYTYALLFSGDNYYNASHMASSKLTIIKKTTSINAKNFVFKATAKTKTVKVTLKTIKNPYDGKTYIKSGKKLTLTVDGKRYTAKITSGGIAKFKVKLTKKGKYVAKIKFEGGKTYESSTKKIKITIK